MAWWREQHQARERNQQAGAELAVSQQMLHEDRERLSPLKRATQRNMFSDMIRDALVEGYHGHEVHAQGGGRERGKR